MTVPQPTPEDLIERTAIDRSARYPVMFFFTSAAAWLFFATVTGFVSSLKLRLPGLWDACPYMGYGRLFPVHFNALVYGWAMQAGIGVMLWMMARLTRSRIQSPAMLIVLGHVWNAAVSIAIISIWFGAGRSIPLLDFPSWLWPVLAASYSLIVVCVIPMFQARRN